ncbi:TRAP transporter small permease [Thermodesulfobacteriota bacterium]
MNPFEIRVKLIVRYMYYVAGGAIVSMMALTCVDVFLRFTVTIYAKYRWEFLTYLHPIPGTYELVCFLGSTAAAFAMAHTSVEAGHVSVSILVRLFSEKTRAIFQVVTSFLGLSFFAIISWQSVIYAQKLKTSGEVSMTLQLPYYPFVYGVAFGAFAVCMVLAFIFINEWTKVLEK